MRRSFLLVVLACLSITSVAAGGQKEEPEQHDPARSISKPGSRADLKRALASYLTRGGHDSATANPHQIAFIDLNGDGRLDALVLLNHSEWCGTGGCTMLLFKGTPAGFEFDSRHPCVRSPVLVSENKTLGWKDIVYKASSKDRPPAQVILKFTGINYGLYPSDSSGLPSQPLTKGTKAF